MNYINLYRKYRPQNFTDVSGQKNIVTILKNSIFLNKFNHAYLFFGSHGTGKTTLARIFGKKINCQKIGKNTFCNKCSFCLNDKNTSLDIIEIDAASHNGIEEIRNLIKKIKFTPFIGRFKVYIIDEVHMLTTQAFNALLKTLEEPPKHVIFILATTEIQKIPYTILSRCQTLEFKTLHIEDIILTLKKITQIEKIKLQSEAYLLIAEFAKGSMRDALNLLDQLIIYKPEQEITSQDIFVFTRFIDQQKIINFINNLFLKKQKLINKDIFLFQQEQKDIYYLFNKMLSIISKFLNNNSVFEKKLIITIPFAKFLFQKLIQKIENIKNDNNKILFLEILSLEMLEYKENISLIQKNDQLNNFSLKQEVILLKKNILEVIYLLLKKKNNEKKDKTMNLLFSKLKKIIFYSQNEKVKKINSFLLSFEKQNNIDNHFSFLDFFLNNQIKAFGENNIVLVLNKKQKVMGKNLLSKENKKTILTFFEKSQFNIKDFILLIEEEWEKIKEDFDNSFKTNLKKIKNFSLSLTELFFYEQKKIEEEIDPILKKAYEFFGKDKVVLEEGEKND